MSHFTVLVVAADIAAALQPFHEFECTGTNDQYVQDIDKTDEAREQFASETTTRLRAPDGTLHSFFNEQGEWRNEFSQPDPEASSRFDSRRRIQFVPEGFEQVELPTSQVETFAEWTADYFGWKIVPHGQEPDTAGEHKSGYVLLDAAGEVVKCVDRTNPKKKWDWWAVGGRWPNKLLFKNGTHGCEGAAGDIDWVGMLAAQAAKAAALYDSITGCIAGREVQSWAQTFKRQEAGEFTFDKAREFYHAQPVVQDLKAGKIIDDWDGAGQLSAVLAAKSRQAYIDAEAKVNSTTWALLQNGHWSERGSMGWWGMSDATSGTTLDYAENFWLTARSLPGDAHVAVVDCHI